MSTDNQNINEIQQKFNEVMQSAPDENNEQFVFSYADLHSLKDVEVPFLIDDLIPANSCSVLFGEDGIGKTMFSIQLCLHIALKYKTFLNLPLKTKHNRALVVATETAKTKFIRAAARQHQALSPNISPLDVQLDFLEGYGVDNMDHLIKEINKKLNEKSYDLIVVDVVGDLFVMNEMDINNNTHARAIVQKLQKLCEVHQTTILAIHHAGKNKLVEKRKTGKIFLEKDDQIGAGAITAKPRAVIAISNNPKSNYQNGNYHTYDNYVHVVKMNEGGRTYVQNAIRCTFDTSTLLHVYKNLVDIASFEAEGPDNAQTSHITPPATIEYNYDQHRKNAITVFGKEDSLTRQEIVTRMKAVYNAGANKIEATGGLLQQLITQGLITKQGKGNYVLAFIPDETDKPAEPKQGDLNLDETPF